MVRRIPTGPYAKFVICEDVVQAVPGAWQKIWEVDLHRTFVCGFEECLNDSMDQAKVEIYVG